MEKIVLLGYGGHAKSVADCIERSGLYEIVGYTDLRDCGGRHKYLGPDEKLRQLYKDGVRFAALGIGFMGNSVRIRDSLVKYAMSIGFSFPVIIDPSAVIALDAVIGQGAFIGKNTVVNADSEIGEYSIINTGTIVEHGSFVGAYSHVAVGVVLCGDVTVGHHTLIGAGSVVIQERKVGDCCIVGANSTVIADVESGSIVYGVAGRGN